MQPDSENIFLKKEVFSHVNLPKQEVDLPFPAKEPTADSEQRAHLFLINSRVRFNKIRNQVSPLVYNFICENVNIFSTQTLIINNIKKLSFIAKANLRYNSIISVVRINDISRINKFFEKVNERLYDKGILIGVVETKDIHKQQILQKFPSGFNYLLYSLDFIVNRIAPKLSITKKLYFFITKGKNRVITKAETFGRLYCCGFELYNERIIEDKLYFVAVKKKLPLYPRNPSYGLLIKLPRIGKGGRLINFYKVRTMHPYSEFIQEYIYITKGLQPGGKINSDFRISTLGKFFRKYWIDELPMLINLIKGDIKVVGVRPLSSHYFSLYSKELQELRIRVKPGLIPPFYVDFPKTIDEIMESELRYLESYFKNPIITDLKYLTIAIYNIFIRKYRSK